MNYNNKVIWITGASSGIGRELALQLDLKGAILILSGRNLTALNELIESCGNPQNHLILPFDLADAECFSSVVEKAWNFKGSIDLLVNNGGISQRSLAIDTSVAVDRKVMEIDYFGAVGLTKALLPKMIANQSGKIVNIVSIAGKIGSSMRSAYSGAKHALIGFMDCLRAEVAKDGIKVVNVCPGWVQTNISRNALTADMSPYDKMDDEIENGMSVAEFVEILLKKLGTNKQEIIIARGRPKLGYHMRRLFPNFYHWLLPRIYQRQQ